jgi:hypothetical protein
VAGGQTRELQSFHDRHRQEQHDQLGGTAERPSPDQRRLIDAQLKEAAKGPYHGPFETAGAAIDFLHREIRKRKVSKTKTTQ